MLLLLSLVIVGHRFVASSSHPHHILFGKLLDENPVPDHSASETPGQATALPWSMDELLGAIGAVVQTEVASAIDRLGSQQSPSSAAPGDPTASTGTC